MAHRFILKYRPRFLRDDIQSQIIRRISLNSLRNHGIKGVIIPLNFHRAVLIDFIFIVKSQRLIYISTQKYYHLNLIPQTNIMIDALRTEQKIHQYSGIFINFSLQPVFIKLINHDQLLRACLCALYVFSK